MKTVGCNGLIGTLCWYKHKGYAIYCNRYAILIKDSAGAWKLRQRFIGNIDYSRQF